MKYSIARYVGGQPVASEWELSLEELQSRTALVDENIEFDAVRRGLLEWGSYLHVYAGGSALFFRDES